MRLLVLILLLANVAFYAWVQYVPESASAEAQLMVQQINPESIRLLSASQVVAERKAEPPKVVSCVEWSGLSSEDIARAQEAVLPLSPGVQVTERKLEETTGWWVFMPPQASRQGAVQKVEELKRIGIDEYFIVQDDVKFRFAISLGVFRSEEAAQKKLEQLQGRGVRTARVGARATPVNRLSLQLRDLQEGAQPKVVELLKEFPGTTIKDCAD
jgi:hypothetical protein